MIARTSYIHTEITETEEIVERNPYNLPAALVYLRNTKYGSTYAMAPNRADPPSAGSKYQLLIVDVNWEPLRIGDTPETHVGYWTGRLGSYDAGLSLQDTQPFTISGYWGLPGAGPWHYAARPAVAGFNDTLGYYGGFYFGPPCPPSALCYAERDGSAVLPARGLYSARIATFDFAPIYGLHGYPWPPSWLGTGNPGDDNVQYGVNVDLVSTGGEDAYRSTARLRFRSHSVDFLTAATPSIVGTTYRVTYRTEIVNRGRETAEGVLYEIFMDDSLSLVSIDVEGASGAPSSAVESSAGVGVTVGDLAAGERATVTAVGEMPLDPGIIALESAIMGFDGQVERGPYYIASTGTSHVLYFPLTIVQ
jgi:hypothetical protein